MAIEKIFADNLEYFTLQTHPSRSYSSGSTGVTGSLYVYPRRSVLEKEVFPLSLFSASFYNDANLDDIRKLAVNNTSSDITSDISAYLGAIELQQASPRKQHTVDILRFVPPFDFTSNTLRKNVVRNILFPYYRSTYPSTHWSISNYHCLNFFTSSAVPTASCLLYPNTERSDTSSQYGISGAFSFDFWIKPTNVQDVATSSYKAGTIMHLSSTYCISLHTGSLKDANGFPTRFKLAMALTQSADVIPSKQVPGSRTFFTSNNALIRNKWHHVTIRWGGSNYNYGSGSFVIDDVIDSTFCVTESLGLGFYDGVKEPAVLVIGNYYEGGNDGNSGIVRFFSADTATREGLVKLDSTGGVFAPDVYDFTHPLNAEIHDVKLYDKYLTSTDIAALNSGGPTSLRNLRFYLPPFFTYESPYRQNVGTFGGVLISPFYEHDGTTTAPFAEKLAFSVGGHYINLENYCRDFVTNNYPRLWELTASVSNPDSTTVLSANTFLYTTGSNRRRLYTMLPCDNGRFTPNFGLLANLSSSRFQNDIGNLQLGAISLNDIVSESLDSRTIMVTGSILESVLGVTPESVGTLPGDSLAILHRMRDTSSNQVVFFDISNLYYGNKIRPGTLVLTDTNLSESGGKVSLILRDDGKGNIYRANASGSHPTWASVGNVLYNEGLIVLKSPQLYFFGENQFEISFKGEQNIHVFTINTFAKSLAETSSSNPSFVSLPYNELANEPDQKYVYITTVNIHDDNLNVIARTKVAQPVTKKSGDKILFRVKMDF